MSGADITGYRYDGGGHGHHHAYLLPVIGGLLEGFAIAAGERRLFELGCGNGATADFLSRRGWDVIGVDPSSDGIARANASYPHLRLRAGFAYDDLAAEYGQFPFVLSFEVVEHVYAPRQFAKTVFDLLKPGGVVLIPTPYHGYWKNLALALRGRLDSHFKALWDHGHIKFWSIDTFGRLLVEAASWIFRSGGWGGFRCLRSQ